MSSSIEAAECEFLAGPWTLDLGHLGRQYCAVLRISARCDLPHTDDALSVEHVEHVVQVHRGIGVGWPYSQAITDADRRRRRHLDGRVLVVEGRDAGTV